MIFNADFRSPDLINENVCAKKSTPHTVTTIAELSPVIPNVAGNNPSGIKNMVYIMICTAVFKSFLPPEGRSLNPAFL